MIKIISGKINLFWWKIMLCWYSRALKRSRLFSLGLLARKNRSWTSISYSSTVQLNSVFTERVWYVCVLYGVVISSYLVLVSPFNQRCWVSCVLVGCFTWNIQVSKFTWATEGSDCKSEILKKNWLMQTVLRLIGEVGGCNVLLHSDQSNQYIFDQNQISRIDALSSSVSQ